MLSDEGAKSRLSGNVDGGIVAIEERSRGDDADLVLGDVGRRLYEGHSVWAQAGAKAWVRRYRRGVDPEYRTKQAIGPATLRID